MRQALAAVAGIFAEQHNVLAPIHDSIDIMFDPKDTGVIGWRHAKPVILTRPPDQFGLQYGIAAKILDIEPGLGDAAIIRLQCAIQLWQKPRGGPSAAKPANAKINIIKISGPADGVGDVVALGPAGIAGSVRNAKRRPFAARHPGIDVLGKIDC